jgi:hypothetical protein
VWQQQRHQTQHATMTQPKTTISKQQGQLNEQMVMVAPGDDNR